MLKKTVLEDSKILREFYNIRMPQQLRDADYYDFVADNTFLAGIVSQVLKGNNLKLLEHKERFEEFIDDEYLNAKNKILEENLNNVNFQELTFYFKVYEKAVNVLRDLNYN